MPSAIKLPSTATTSILTAALEISLSQILIILYISHSAREDIKIRQTKRSTSEMVNLLI